MMTTMITSTTSVLPVLPFNRLAPVTSNTVHLKIHLLF